MGCERETVREGTQVQINTETETEKDIEAEKEWINGVEIAPDN